MQRADGTSVQNGEAAVRSLGMKERSVPRRQGAGARGCSAEVWGRGVC